MFRITTIIMTTAALAIPVMAQTDGVEISGFTDYLVVPDRDGGDGRVSVGQAEIDLAAEIDGGVAVEVAVAYDPDAEAFGLGALTVGFPLADSDAWSADLSVGLFDVPFGIDWRVYPSPDRKMVTAPFATDMTHAGWNEMGAQVNASRGAWTATFFAVNDMPRDHLTADTKIPEYTAGGAAGGRLGWTPATTLELGGSAASLSDATGNEAMTLWGVDAQWNGGPLSMKGEYVGHGIREIDGSRIANAGWYAQAGWDFSTQYLAVRYDTFQHEYCEEACAERVSACWGRALTEGSQVRLERSFGLNGVPDEVLMQIVAGF